MRVLGISGSNTAPSKTRLLVETAMAALDPAVEADLFVLSEERLEDCDGRDPAAYDGATRRAIERVETADAIILGCPIYRGSYPGKLKNLFDVLPNDALAGKPAGLIASAGTDHHYLAIEHQLRPLLAFFRVHLVPGAVYANNADFADGRLTSATVIERLEQLAVGVTDLAAALPASSAGAAGPTIPRQSLRES